MKAKILLICVSTPEIFFVEIGNVRNIPTILLEVHNFLKLEIAPVRLNFDGLFAKILKICTFYRGSFNLTKGSLLDPGPERAKKEQFR